MLKQKIVIVVEGGCVRDVYASTINTECRLIDLDDQDEEENSERDFAAEITEATKDLVPVF